MVDPVATFDDVKSPEQLVDAFRSRGLKVTPQRQLLFRLLDGNTTHPTAEALYATASSQMPGISLRTVYTTLTDLADMGEIDSLTVDGRATRFDPNTDEHHHAVCDVCGDIGDVYVEGADALAVAEFDGFAPTTTSILFHGTCHGCSTTSP